MESRSDYILQRVTNILKSLGVPAHIKGYHYLREGIVLSINDSSYLNSLTKQLYPKIAETFDTTASRVERSIRHAIELSWERCPESNLEIYFGPTAILRDGRPSNGEYIAVVTDMINIELVSKRKELDTEETTK